MKLLSSRPLTLAVLLCVCKVTAPVAIAGLRSLPIPPDVQRLLNQHPDNLKKKNEPNLFPEDIASLLDGRAPVVGAPGVSNTEFHWSLHQRLSLPEDRDLRDFSDHELRLDLKHRFNQEARAVLEAEAYITSQNLPRGHVFDERKQTRPPLTFREAYLAWHKGHFEFKGGQFITTWGKSDLFQPTNLPNALDYTRILETRKIPTLGAMAVFSHGEVELNAVVSPLFYPSRFPLKQSHYDFLPWGFSVSSGDSPNDVQFASRISWTNDVVDVALVYGMLNDYGGRYRPDLAVAGNYTRTFDRTRQFGGSVSVPVAGLEVHAESLAQFYRETEPGERAIRTVAGVNYLTSGVFGDNSELGLVLEYVHTTEDKKHRTDLFPDRFMEAAMAGRVRLKLSEEFQVSDKAIVDLKNLSYFMNQLKFEYRVSANLSFDLGYEGFLTAEHPMLRTLDERDLFFGGITVQF